MPPVTCEKLMPACSKTAPSRSTRHSPPPPSGRCQVSRRKLAPPSARSSAPVMRSCSDAQVSDDGGRGWRAVAHGCTRAAATVTFGRTGDDMSGLLLRRRLLLRDSLLLRHSLGVLRRGVFVVGAVASPRPVLPANSPSLPSSAAFRPQRPPRSGAAAISAWHSSSVSDFGSRSFGILPFFLPSVM